MISSTLWHLAAWLLRTADTLIAVTFMGAAIGLREAVVIESLTLAVRSAAFVVPGGLGTGISVIPVGYWTAPALASCAATVGEISGGKFVLGIGSGAIHNPAFQRSLGLPNVGPIGAMREYLTTVRALLRGESVEHEGKAITLHGISIGFTPPRVPVALGALGPQMLRLAGEASDGAALNWCTPETIAWSRELVAEGAKKAGRDPSEIAMIEYIRICVDEDEDVARRAFVKALMGYAMARPGVSKELGYRGHFGRMGFDEALTELEERRDRGASQDELVEAFPTDLAKLVGYYGPAKGAAAAFRRLAEGLDTAIVRVVAARPSQDSIVAVMEACRP